MLVLGAILLFSFIRVETRSTAPLLDLRLFRIREFAAGNTAQLLNALANLRSAFAATKTYPLEALLIPMKSGMGVGLLLVSVELFSMISILVFTPPQLAGESLGKGRGFQVVEA